VDRARQRQQCQAWPRSPVHLASVPEIARGLLLPHQRQAI
jgi:hypothetical protein